MPKTLAKERIANYFVAYVERIVAPIRCGVEVKKVQKNVGRLGFRVDTSDGMVEAIYVVAATGPFHRPIIPTIVLDEVGFIQIYSNAYRNSTQLPDDSVLVVGTDSSGMQIADEFVYRKAGLSFSWPAQPASPKLSWN